MIETIHLPKNSLYIWFYRLTQTYNHSYSIPLLIEMLYISLLQLYNDSLVPVTNLLLVEKHLPDKRQYRIYNTHNYHTL